MGILITFKENSPPPPLSPPSPPTPTTSWERMTSSLNSRPPSTPPRDPRPEVMPMPPLPRPLPSRTSRRPLPLESSRDSMMDNQSLRTPSSPSKRSSMSEEWARNEQLRLRVDFDFLTYFKQINYKYLRANNLLV